MITLYRTWCEAANRHNKKDETRQLRKQSICLYQQEWLTPSEAAISLQKSVALRRLARCLNDLGFHLNRTGAYEQVLSALDRCITLKQQGYVEVDTLADAYGEQSQILAGLGRFQEALVFDAKAIAEVQRLVDAGYTFSQEEMWVYRVNRGRLYLRLGRVDEAELLLREALPHIRPRRRMYRMFADRSLEEIEQWRQQAKSSHYQLDWRWIERFRELAAYDSHGWLAPAGPFTEEEQQQWNALFPSRTEEAVKDQLDSLITQSRERELAIAIAQQREPHLCYPALEIEQVRRRLATLLELDAEISQSEPNVIVRRLYHGAIEEELDYLHLIEATYEGDTEKYWACNLRLMPLPTAEEIAYGLSHIKRMVLQGLKQPESAEISQQFGEFLRTRLHISLDLASKSEDIQEVQAETVPPSTQPSPTVSTQATKRFFEAVLQESGYDNWQVVIDAAATHPRVEQGLRQFFLPNRPFSLKEIKFWFAHELVGHVARCMAGERSPLGLLGIHTKNSLPTEEGLALYHERQVATLHGQAFSEEGIWMGALATGLACGAMTPPQTFLSLFTFFDFFSLLRQLLKRPDVDTQKAQQAARKHALSLCLRVYLGVPDLEQAGVCYLQDAVYLHGIRMIERAVTEDKSVLDRLAVGVVALELLPDLQELGIMSAPQPLMRRAYDPDLDTRILSFETPEEHAD